MITTVTKMQSSYNCQPVHSNDNGCFSMPECIS